jgi:hypothetical protein
MSAHSDFIQRWYDGLAMADVERLLLLFAPTSRIRNAAHEPVAGPGAARAYLEDFFARTTARRFQLLSQAENGRQIFAAWAAEIVFRKGVKIAGRTLRRDFAHKQRGVDWFTLDDRGRVTELEVVHETSSLLRALDEQTE